MRANELLALHPTCPFYTISYSWWRALFVRDVIRVVPSALPMPFSLYWAAAVDIVNDVYFFAYALGN